MDFYMYHGRTDPEGFPQTKTVTGDRVEYIDIDDWGFEGPRLEGVIGFHCTYGGEGHWNLYFEDSRAADKARIATNWVPWDENALTVDFSKDGSLVMIRERENGRCEYFGDWGIK